MSEHIEHSPYRAIEQVTIFFVSVILLLSVAECSGKKDEPASAQPASILFEVDHKSTYNLPDTCHQERFLRFALPQNIILCMHKGGIITQTSSAPPSQSWMKHRYQSIVDSLRSRNPHLTLINPIN